VRELCILPRFVCGSQDSHPRPQNRGGIGLSPSIVASLVLEKRWLTMCIEQAIPSALFFDLVVAALAHKFQQFVIVNDVMVIDVIRR